MPELDTLLASLDALGRGQAQVLDLVGEPGSGKTRLLNELVVAADQRSIATVSGRCGRAESDIPFHVLRQILCDASVMIGADFLRPEVVHGFRHYLGATAGGALSDREKVAFFRLVRLVLERAAWRGLLVVLDDVHWVDAATSELLDYLIRWPVNAPMIVVMARRPAVGLAGWRSPSTGGPGARPVQQLRLGPMTLDHAAELLALDSRDPALRRLHEDAHGLPLYLLALRRATKQAAPFGGPLYAGVASHEADTILSECSLLPGTASGVATAAAVLGDGFDAETLAQVADLTSDELATPLTVLSELDVVRSTGDGRYVFRHPVLRSVLYDAVEPVARTEAHRRALAALAESGAPAAEQAVHIARSTGRPGKRDTLVLLQAAKEAIQQAPDTAVQWLRLALDSPMGETCGPFRAEALLTLARALGMSGRLAASRDTVDEVLAVARDEDRTTRTAAAALRAVMDCFRGRHQEAQALLDAEVSRLRPADAPLEAVGLAVAYAILGLCGGPWPTRGRTDFALVVAERHGDPLAVAAAHAVRGLCAADTGQSAAVAAALKLSAARVDVVSDADLARFPEVLAVQGWAELLLGRLVDARRHFTSGVRIARKTAHDHLVPILLSGLCHVHRCLGEIALSRRMGEEALHLAELMDLQHVKGMALANESLNLAWTAKTDGGRAGETAHRAIEALADSHPGLAVTGALALIQAERAVGRPEHGPHVLVDLGGGPELDGVLRCMRPVCFELLAAASADLGDREAVVGWAARAATAAKSYGGPLPWAYALGSRAHALRFGRPAEAANAYDEAARIFQQEGMQTARAEMLVLSTRCLAESGNRKLARAVLETAEGISHRCEAARVLADIRAIGRRLDAADRSGADDAPAPTGLYGLTRREREIATLVGLGKRTRDVAEKLSLSPRTVDVHLTRIYRKLNLTSRAELVRVMTELRRHPHDQAPPARNAG